MLPIPARRLLCTQEVPSGRNADTRQWENVYKVPETSLLSGGPRGLRLPRYAINQGNYVTADGVMLAILASKPMLCVNQRTWIDQLMVARTEGVFPDVGKSLGELSLGNASVLTVTTLRP